jgi:hypothetical protein
MHRAFTDAVQSLIIPTHTFSPMSLPPQGIDSDEFLAGLSHVML